MDITSNSSINSQQGLNVPLLIANYPNNRDMETIKEKDLRSLLGNHIKTSRVKQRQEWEIKFENGTALQDYQSVVCVRLNDGRVFYAPHHTYSCTTSKHLSQWGEPCKAERLKMLEDGRATAIVPTSGWYKECNSLKY